MDAEQLRAIQAPIKEQYRDTPDAAIVTLKSQGEIGDGLSCSVQTSKALIEAGLHPATGGSGMQACSGDMSGEQCDTLIKLTERYCVVYQTIRNSPPVDVTARLSKG